MDLNSYLATGLSKCLNVCIQSQIGCKAEKGFKGGFFFFFGVVYEISSECFSKEQKEN